MTRFHSITPLLSDHPRKGVRCLRPVLAVCVAVVLAGCVGGAQEEASSVARAQDNCRAATDLGDRDDDFSAFQGVCASETVFSEGGVSWRIQTLETGRRGPLFVLPHDDENAAQATAAYALSRYGGAATMVETGGRRSNGGIDPNRFFDAGRLDCGKGGADAFVAAMLGPGGRPVIALHTNARGSARTGGAGSISIRAPYSGTTAFPSTSATGGLASEDAMVILASRRGPEDGRVRSLAQSLNDAGVHVLVETVDTARTDCSLSHYAVANGLTYANVEAADGDTATQRRILDILMERL